MTNLLLLAAEAAEPQDWLHTIVKPEILVFVIPIVAILGGISFAIIKAVIAHRERMAKIQHGIDPDAKSGPG